ncbi:MAG: hypothetical protein LUH47_06635 [Clostridiales bacterium]|nr:hypothetical protein [Clostridiales bacterium]
MYYRAAKRGNYVSPEIKSLFGNGEIYPENRDGIKTSSYDGDLKTGNDLIRGFNNYTEFSEGAESPVSNGKGGYVPSGREMPAERERNRLDSVSYDGVYSREVKLMHEFYEKINSFLYPVIIEVINDMEYPGSTIYDYGLPSRKSEQGETIRDFEISRESLGQMTDKVYEKAVQMSDDIDEILNDDNELTAGSTREELLKAAIERLLLTELFLSRRPFYRNTAGAYRFFEGRYDGVNPLF